MLEATNSGRPTRRLALKWLLATMLGVATAPSLASAQEASSAPPGDDWPYLNPIGPVWAVTVSDASLRAEPDIADNRFGLARPGTTLQVLSRDGDWSYVFNPHMQGTAYVSSNLLAPGAAPSRFVSMAAPALVEAIQDYAVITEDSTLAFYPSLDKAAMFMPLEASSVEMINGSVRGADGNLWYQTADFYYFPSNGVFLPSAADSFSGRWLQATLLPTTSVIAYEAQTPVRTMPALRGVARFPTPTGVFSILRRVPNETMDSMTLGIPHDSPFGYLVKNVLYTQYFTPDGASLHDNYWSSNFGGIGSHGCLGLSLADSKWLWDWATIGTPVVVNP